MEEGLNESYISPKVSEENVVSLPVPEPTLLPTDQSCVRATLP